MLINGDLTIKMTKNQEINCEFYITQFWLLTLRLEHVCKRIEVLIIFVKIKKTLGSWYLFQLLALFESSISFIWKRN